MSSILAHQNKYQHPHHCEVMTLWMTSYPKIIKFAQIDIFALPLLCSGIMLLVNKIEWNKLHFVANLIAFKMVINFTSDYTSILFSWGWKSHCPFFFLTQSVVMLDNMLTYTYLNNHYVIRYYVYMWLLVRISTGIESCPATANGTGLYFSLSVYMLKIE